VTVRATIAGMGTAVPEKVVTNADYEARLDTSDAWIVERTGIRERRHAGPGETTGTLAVEAGAAAIKDAGLVPDDIGLVMVATATPDHPIPSTSAYVQDGLGLHCGAFDVGAACAGFVYGLVTAASFVVANDIDNVLVIGSETLSRIANQDDRGTAIIFGDGAGAAVVKRTEGDAGLLSWDLGCDGSAAGLLGITAGGSRMPTTPETVAAGLHWLHMDGSEVFRRAVRVVVESSGKVLDRAGVTAEQIDWFVPHQANVRIIDAAVSRLGINPDRVVRNIDRYGNTSAASVPIALEEAAPKDGDLVLLTGFGAGMTWASAVLRWGGV
jgi:3-oxoacyl-[acyl-carrier-protein] synthase-3